MLEDFVQRFKTVVDTLMAHPQVRLTHLWIGPGASDAELDALAAAWQRAVPEALATLYRQANGLQLRWVDAAHETYDPARDDSPSFTRSDAPLWEIGGVAAGVFELPTLAELAEREPIAERFDPVSDADAHLHDALVFDSFGESQDSVIYFREGDDPRLVIAEDYLAHVPEPGERTVSRYLDHVLASWCAVWHRDEDRPRPLASLLRTRAPLDPTRLVGQRVHYLDEGRANSVMHGRVLTLTDATQTPKWWFFARTFAEVEDDFGERILVPMRGLFPPDPDDSYERLRADPAALVEALSGPPRRTFEQLAPIADFSHRLGLPEGPSLLDAVWPHAALYRNVPAARLPSLLLAAADRLLRSPELHAEREVAWSPQRPRRPHRPKLSFASLGQVMLDALLVHAAGRPELPLASWLGPDHARRLRALLELLASRDPLRGYDPLADPSKTVGYLHRALQRRLPVALDVSARNPQRGDRFGLPALRLIRPSNNASPATRA